MAAAKTFVFTGPATALTVYALIQRVRDGGYLDSDFKFRTTPTAPAQALTEMSIGAVKNQNYLFTNSTYPWEDGHYYITIYLQAGALPAYNTDTVIGSAVMYVYHDEVKLQPFSLSQEV